MFSNEFINLQNVILVWDFDYTLETLSYLYLMKTKKNMLRKPQKKMSNIAVLTSEPWINPESYTPEKEITLAELKEKQCRGKTLFSRKIAECAAAMSECL